MTKLWNVSRFILGIITVAMLIGYVMITTKVIDPAMKKVNIKLGKELTDERIS